MFLLKFIKHSNVCKPIYDIRYSVNHL